MVRSASLTWASRSKPPVCSAHLLFLVQLGNAHRLSRLGFVDADLAQLVGVGHLDALLALASATPMAPHFLLLATSMVACCTACEAAFLPIAWM